MTTSGRVRRGGTDEGSDTRTAVLDAAERLFAENGIHAVSTRSIAEASRQGNNAAVGYHFGTKAGLVHAIARRRFERIEQFRVARLGAVPDDGDLRAWITCLVAPTADHLAELGTPSWFARFRAHLVSDPAHRDLVVPEVRSSASFRAILRGISVRIPPLPPDTRRTRADLGRLMLVHAFAEREQALADGRVVSQSTWADAAADLTEALVAVWLAPPPSSPVPGPPPLSRAPVEPARSSSPL